MSYRIGNIAELTKSVWKNLGLVYNPGKNYCGQCSADAVYFRLITIYTTENKEYILFEYVCEKHRNKK